MIKGLRYLASKIEEFKIWLILKWNSFLEKLKM